MKRIKILFTCFGVVGILLVSRIFYFSVIKNESLTKSVIAQRTQKINFKSPRGIIYDRNMIKITDANMKMTVKDGKPYYIGTRTNDILNHVVGYISDDGNGSGIEGAFNYVLSPDIHSSISYLKDINNNMVSEGYDIDIENSYEGIALTIDYHIQEIAEKSMDKFGIKGAVVVANCESGEILAMASRPNYDASNIENYLDGTDGELLNKAVLQYNPGSVFKIVVTAAFLENHYNDVRLYECKGKSEIDGIEFICHKKDGHGIQTLEQAFANSCNCAFYEIGNTVGGKEIYKYSADFGIGEEVLHINGIREDVGMVPKNISGLAELANISIGQGDVMATPLQITDVLCTICNGGMRKQLTLIKGIVDADGICMETAETEFGRVISETTARRLMNMMNKSVSEGTGSNAKLEYCAAGGKTGSAETGWKKDGEIMQQGWFAGYFPSEDPKYVCVVMAENGISGSDSACPVFRSIGNEMCVSGFLN